MVQNPHITTAESVYQRNTAEFISPAKRDERIEIDVSKIIRPENQQISTSNVAKVNAGDERNIFGYRETRTYSQPPPPERVGSYAPSNNVKFSYQKVS